MEDMLFVRRNERCISCCLITLSSVYDVLSMDRILIPFRLHKSFHSFKAHLSLIDALLFYCLKGAMLLRVKHALRIRVWLPVTLYRR